ncbi:MAG: hypothetical protein LQ350_001312 [Teloschistes chrysophthalmus]|nr:MAG: hypothetical protein LQ350_001312 [Niorma chrysophthalma]
MAYSPGEAVYPQPIKAPAITPDTMGNIHICPTHIGGLVANWSGNRGTDSKNVPRRNPRSADQFSRIWTSKVTAGSVPEEIFCNDGMTLDALDERNYWQSLYMCDKNRYGYLTQPPRVGRQILLQRGILYWKYSLMRSLILPMIGIEKAMFEAEYELRGCGGSQIFKAVDGNQIPSMMRDWRFVSAVAVEEDWRCNATSMIQGRVEEPSFVAVNPELLEIRRCQRVLARNHGG